MKARRGRAAGVVSMVLLAALALPVSVASPAWAAPQVVTVFNTAGEHPFAVPAGVTRLHVRVVGGHGGEGGGPGGEGGGQGQVVEADIVVPPATTILAVVGERGNDGDGGTGGGPAFGGGAAGGTDFFPYGGGGGGGASDIRLCSLSNPNCNTLASRQIVAGGGGGGGGDCFAIGCESDALRDGDDGTEGAGGDGGVGLVGAEGVDGTFGFGGHGGFSQIFPASAGGGGGGGGWYGGGGGGGGVLIDFVLFTLGADGGTGGAGSSYAVGTATNVLHGLTDDPPSVTISYAAADLRLGKTCPPGPVAPGDVVQCTITVTNDGPTDAAAVTVIDDLPAGVSLTGTSGGGFSCGTGDPFTCTRPSLLAGQAAVIEISVRVGPTVEPGGLLTNSASVSSTTLDPNPGNNGASTSTTVISCTINGAGDILGTPGNDVICGSAGNDRIAALGGNDVVFAGDGNDDVSGGDGDDRIVGGNGDDRLTGGPGNDQLFGGIGIDRLAGNAGDDLLVTMDGVAGDFEAGGTHTSGDTCLADPGDTKVDCET